MRQSIRLTLYLLLVVGSYPAFSQATPTASRALQVSAFGGLSGVYTGLNGGRNLSITAGADLGFQSRYSLYPSIELRGTYPISNGHIDSQKNVLGGLRVAKIYGRFSPYADILAGLGQIHYDPLYPNLTRTFAYSYSSSTVISPGGGLNYRLNDRFGVKIDAQYQRYSTPVTASGHLYATPITVGVIYRFFGDATPR